MTSEQTLVVAFAAFVGSAGTILTAMAFYIRSNANAIKTNSDTAGYAEKARADVEVLRERSASNVTDKLVEIAAASMKIQQDGLKIQQEMVEVARANGQAFNENAAQMRGMVAMQDDHTKLLRTTAQSIDDVQSQVAGITKVTTTLQTDIEGTLGGQYGAIVAALTGIGVQLAALVTSSATNATIEARLTEITQELRLTHKQFMEKLSPLVLKHLGEITDENHAENGIANHPILPSE